MSNPAWTEPAQFEWSDPDEAVAFLMSRGLTHNRGMITQPQGLALTEQDYAALDFLCGEWDYGFTPEIIDRRWKDEVIANRRNGADQ